MSTLNLQVKSKRPEHLLVFTAIPQPGAPQEVFETDAPSAFQVGCFLVGPVRFVFWFPNRLSTRVDSGTPFDI